MGMSRRKFTKEFREEAVRRLELGASVAEVARACEVNPNVLYRWRRELRDYGAQAFTGNGQRRGEEQQVAELERKVGRQALAARRWRSIFCDDACSMSRSSGNCRH
jgi:transposase